MKLKMGRSIALMVIMCLVSGLLIPSRADAAARLSKKSLTMDAGETTYLYIYGASGKVKWSSSNKKIATVSNGKVTAVKDGRCTIKAKAGKKVLKCKVKVNRTDFTDKIEIVSEYTLPDSIGWYTYHFMVVKNNSDETVDISTSSLAYSTDGKMVGADDGDFNALGAGCTSLMYESFDTDKEIGRFETTLKATKSEYYKSVIQDLDYVQNDIEGGAIFQVTNNGDEAAEFVEGHALFFSGDKIVDFAHAYFTDDDYELKPGKTISKQLDCYEDFDRIEFYLDGRR